MHESNLILLCTLQSHRKGNGHPSCSSSGFHCVGVRLIYWSLRSSATFVICLHWSLFWPFLYTFPSLLPFSYISSHSPSILAVIFLVFWNLLASLSRIFSVIYHLIMCPAHFIRLFNCFANYASFSSNFFSQVFHSPSPHSHFPYYGYAPYPVVLTYL